MVEHRAGDRIWSAPPRRCCRISGAHAVNRAAPRPGSVAVSGWSRAEGGGNLAGDNAFGHQQLGQPAPQLACPLVCGRSADTWGAPHRAASRASTSATGTGVPATVATAASGLTDRHRDRGVYSSRPARSRSGPAPAHCPGTTQGGGATSKRCRRSSRPGTAPSRRRAHPRPGAPRADQVGLPPRGSARASVPTVTLRPGGFAGGDDDVGGLGDQPHQLGLAFADRDHAHVSTLCRHAAGCPGQPGWPRVIPGSASAGTLSVMSASRCPRARSSNDSSSGAGRPAGRTQRKCTVPLRWRRCGRWPPTAAPSPVPGSAVMVSGCRWATAGRPPRAGSRQQPVAGVQGLGRLGVGARADPSASSTVGVEVEPAGWRSDSRAAAVGTAALRSLQQVGRPAWRSFHRLEIVRSRCQRRGFDEPNGDIPRVDGPRNCRWRWACRRR